MPAIPTDLIDVRSDARAVDETAVAALAESIAEVGLINPILVRSNGDRWELIAGRHRLTATLQLGLAEIDACIVTTDDLRAELAMIDENLFRADLSPAERAKQTARRKAIYLELHPETAHGANLEGAGVANLASPETPAFATATAKATGQSERSVQRDAERGQKVIAEVLDLIRDTKLDTGTYLDKLKKLTPNDQFRAATRDLSDLRRVEREREKARKAAKLDADVKARAAKEAAEIIAEHVPGEWWDSLKANLYAAGAKHVADALTNITGQSVMDHAA